MKLLSRPVVCTHFQGLETNIYFLSFFLLKLTVIAMVDPYAYSCTAVQLYTYVDLHVCKFEFCYWYCMFAKEHLSILDCRSYLVHRRAVFPITAVLFQFRVAVLYRPEMCTLSIVTICGNLTSQHAVAPFLLGSSRNVTQIFETRFSINHNMENREARHYSPFTVSGDKM